MKHAKLVKLAKPVKLAELYVSKIYQIDRLLKNLFRKSNVRESERVLIYIGVNRPMAEK